MGRQSRFPEGVPAPKRSNLVITTGRPVLSVAKELGMSEKTLGNWVRQQRAGKVRDSLPGAASESEREALLRLDGNIKSRRLHQRQRVPIGVTLYGFIRVHDGVWRWCGKDRSQSSSSGIEDQRRLVRYGPATTRSCRCCLRRRSREDGWSWRLHLYYPCRLYLSHRLAVVCW